MQDLLYNKNSIIGRLKNYFFLYFKDLSVPTADTLFLIVLSIIAVESVNSIRFLYKHFLKSVTKKSLNAFYYACSYAKIDYSGFMNVTASLALSLIPEALKSQPVFLCIDDTVIAKFGQKFEDVSKIFDHAAHSGSNYLNGHCFVSLMLCIPVWDNKKYNRKIHYCAVPLGYRMWQKDKSKLQLAADMVCKVMPTLSDVSQLLLLCDSWYAKKDITQLIDKFKNLDIICAARCDSVIYDLPPERTHKRGRPAKYGRRLSLIEDFTLSKEKIGDYFIGYRKVLTNLFANLEVMAYVTAANKDTNTRRLFFSTVHPANLHIACAWQEKAPLNQTGVNYMNYIPLFLYSFRWNIEVSYYEQKTFWSLGSYMVRSRAAIELIVNLINITYCCMKFLPYMDDSFSKNQSVQEIRFSVSQQIREQVFIATFVNSVESTIKSNAVIKLLKQRIFSKTG